MASRRWRVVLGAMAERDFAAVIAWTAARFGESQAGACHQTLIAAVRALEDGPTIAGARSRHEISPSLMSLPVARGGSRGRHFIMFRAIEVGESRTIEVVRLLHDAMDLAQHIPRARMHLEGQSTILNPH
jgi:toxin ParE1/3/4